MNLPWLLSCPLLTHWRHFQSREMRRIRLVSVPAHRMVSIRFSGFFNQGNIEKYKNLLKEWLVKNGYEGEGEFIIAGYNPPWIPGFLARNEVMIKIKEKIPKTK